MTEQEQIQTLLAQNAELLAQNRLLMSMLQPAIPQATPAPTLPVKPKKPTKRENRAVHVTIWYHSIEKELHPLMADILKKNLQAKKLWLD